MIKQRSPMQIETSHPLGHQKMSEKHVFGNIRLPSDLDFSVSIGNQ